MRTSPIARLLIGGSHSDDAERPADDDVRCRRRARVAPQPGRVRGQRQLGGRTDDWWPGAVGPVRYSWTDSSGRLQSSASSFHFLPEALEIDVPVDPGERKRSLFTVVVYTAKLKLRGRFAPPRMGDVRPVPDLIHWDRATISLGVGDPRGIARAVDLNWNGQTQRFVHGSARIGLLISRVEAPAPGLTPDRTEPYPFELDLELRGASGTPRPARWQRNDRAADVELAASKLRRHRAGSAASR